MDCCSQRNQTRKLTMADRQDEARDHRSVSTSSNAVAGLNRSVGITRLVLPGKPHMRKATVEQFRADYDNTVALYRQTVLTTFQQVEDNLASLRILAQQI